MRPVGHFAVEGGELQQFRVRMNSWRAQHALDFEQLVSFAITGEEGIPCNYFLNQTTKRPYIYLLTID